MDKQIVIFAVICMIKVTLGGRGGNQGTQPAPDCCVDSCYGVRTGHYPSCRGCEYYVSCNNGLLYDRECPTGFLWNPEHSACDFPRYVTCAKDSARPTGVPDTGSDPEPEPIDFDSTEDSAELVDPPPIRQSNNTETSDDDNALETNLEVCLIWVVLCLIAVALLFALSIYMLCSSGFGCGCLKRRRRDTTESYTQFPDDLSIPSYSEVTSKDYDVPRYVSAPPLPDRNDDGNYQELFPIYEELSRYRDTYLELHGYTYLQLVDHARSDVVRRDIARSVGPLYLTLCHLNENSPKAYEATQDRVKNLVQQVWQEIAPSAVVNIPSLGLKNEEVLNAKILNVANVLQK